MEQPIIANGGLQNVPQIAVQYVYLDFDGELTSYNGEILTVDNVEVKDSSLTEERIAHIVAELNAKYASQNVIFVTEKPETAEYSTIYIGKTEAFSPYGNFAGLAETIDSGNKNKTDNAFVMLDSTASNEAIISTISHEADHLLGTLNHGGNGLSAYAKNVSSGTSEINMNINNNVDVLKGGAVQGASIFSGGQLLISSGGYAEYVTVNSGGTLYVYDGGTAIKIKENGGRVVLAEGACVSFEPNTFSDIRLDSGNAATLHSGTTANNITISSGHLMVSGGGTANNIKVYYGGYLYVYDGAVANSVTVKNRGSLDVRGGTVHDIVMYTSCKLRVYSGSIASNISLAEGAISYLSIAPNTYWNGTYNNSSFEMKNGSISDYHIKNKDIIVVYSGGVAHNTSVNSGGVLSISSGGIVNNATVNNGGSLCINKDGIADNTVVISGGSMRVSSGGVATFTAVNPGGYLTVFSGGTATLYFNPWEGQIYSSSGAVISRLKRDKEFYLGNHTSGVISKTNAASGQIVSSGVSAIVFDGNIVDTTVTSGGVMYISGTVPTVEYELLRYTKNPVNNTGFSKNNDDDNSPENNDEPSEQNETVGAEKNTADGGEIKIYGYANDNSTLNNGKIYVYTGALAENNKVFENGKLIVSGGNAHTNTVFNGGTINVFAGGSVESTSVLSGGYIFVDNDANATDTVIQKSGVMSAKFATLDDTWVLGSAHISGGIVSKLIVEEEASVTLSNDITVENLTNYGETIIKDKAVLQGEIILNNRLYTNANIFIDGMIIFGLTDKNSSIGLLNSYANISSCKEFYLVDSSYDKYRNFRLIDNAAGFVDKKLVIKNKNNDKTYALYDITTDGILVYHNDKSLNFFKYSLLPESYNDLMTFIVTSEMWKWQISKTFKMKDLKFGSEAFGKTVNKRKWLSCELKDISMTFTSAVNAELDYEFKFTGDISFTAGILTVSSNFSNKDNGIYIVCGWQENESGVGFGVKGWDIVGSFSAKLQQVDRRFKFRLGNRYLDTRTIEGIAEIDTKAGVYTMTVDWERSQWGTFQEVSVTAVFKECTITVNAEDAIKNEQTVDLSSLTISMSDDPNRKRQDLGMHVYAINGECGNLARSDESAAYFEGDIAFTWMSKTVRVENKWMKELFTKLGIAKDKDNTVKFSIIDTSLQIKMDVDCNFAAYGTLRLLNAGEKSAATIEGAVEYCSKTELIKVVGNLDILGFVGANALLVSQQDNLRVSMQTSITIPAWMGWFTGCKMASAFVELAHSSAATTISVWGELSSQKNTTYVGFFYNFTTGESFKIDDFEDVEAIFDYNVGILEQGQMAIESYEISEETLQTLLFQGNYSGASEEICVCIANETTGEVYHCSMSSDKVKSNYSTSVQAQYDETVDIMAFNEDGFTIAISAAAAGIWTLTLQDNGSDLENVNLMLTKEAKENVSTCQLEYFSVKNLTSSSVEISYSITGFNSNTTVELYCREKGTQQSMPTYLTNLKPGIDQCFIWKQTKLMQGGVYEFYLRLAGSIIPVESDATGEYVIVDSGSNTIVVNNDVIGNGIGVQLTPIFSNQYETQEYSLDQENWEKLTADTELKFDCETDIFFRGYDELTERYCDVYTYHLESKIQWQSLENFTWESDVENANYFVELSTDNNDGCIFLETNLTGVSFLGSDTNKYWGRVKSSAVGVWTDAATITDSPPNDGVFKAENDGKMDIFFANANGKWGVGYAAQHAGILNGWCGTNEQVTLAGKNKLADIFEGSSDANILVMTDDTNGDALFVDDIYTALPGTVAEQQARIAKIDEIRAGAGDDIVDMTSQRFAYIGDGVKIYGGLGNDTIWANNGNNTLLGDAGNDRLVGGANDDVIIGGIGNDSMHGGGGDDIFCFGENWGNDTVEQLSGGNVTLWFEAGSESNWNADTLTYTDGVNSVTVSGLTEVSLKFGGETPVKGAFLDAASEKIFEEKDKGMLA